MAGQNGTASHALELLSALEREPYKFSFFEAIRRLECLHAHKPRIGDSLKSSDDPVRLGQVPSLAFAPSTLASFEPGQNGAPDLLKAYFFGMFGPNGPLPLHLTEYARDRVRNSDDATFSRFADIFHHRLMSLFYRAWANAQPTVSFDRPDEDNFAAYVGSSFGLAMASLRGRDALPDYYKLHFAGRMSCQTRNPEGLRDMLSVFFGLPVQIEEFVGHWLTLPERFCWRLGESPETGALGVTATVGSRVWDCQHKFRIVVGPIGFDDFQRLLPGVEGLERLVAIVRNYLGDELAWDLNLILLKDEVPMPKLGNNASLGRTCWLKSTPTKRDADDLTLTPHLQAG